MRNNYKYLLAVGIQLLILIFMIVVKFSILSGGTVVNLKILPIDPRDPLRGDYVTFQYEISQIPAYQRRVNQDRIGREVFVVLRQYGKYWRYGQILEQKPTDGQLFLRGVVSNNGRIEYGLEQYFIPEGTGRDFNFRSKEAYAEVAIDNDGRGVIKQIYVDGKKWPFEK